MIFSCFSLWLYCNYLWNVKPSLSLQYMVREHLVEESNSHHRKAGHGIIRKWNIVCVFCCCCVYVSWQLCVLTVSWLCLEQWVTVHLICDVQCNVLYICMILCIMEPCIYHVCLLFLLLLLYIGPDEMLALRWNSQHGCVFVDGSHFRHELDLGDELKVDGQAPFLRIFDPIVEKRTHQNGVKTPQWGVSHCMY